MILIIHNIWCILIETTKIYVTWRVAKIGRMFLKNKCGAKKGFPEPINSNKLICKKSELFIIIWIWSIVLSLLPSFPEKSNITLALKSAYPSDLPYQLSVQNWYTTHTLLAMFGSAAPKEKFYHNLLKNCIVLSKMFHRIPKCSPRIFRRSCRFLRLVIWSYFLA